MIHLVSLDDLPPFVVDHLCRRLFMAYGVGCDHLGHVDAPRSASVDGGLDAMMVLRDAPEVNRYTDDRAVFLTVRPLAFPEGPVGIPPSDGFADLASGTALVTTAGLDRPGAAPGPDNEDAWIDFSDRLARRAVQQVGFLWGLHRCVDPRCAMYLPWPSAGVKPGAEADPTLCDFCRGKSEVRLDRTRS